MFVGSQFKMLIIKTGGGLELIYKNSFSFDKIENKLFKIFNKNIFFLNDHIKIN